jgi:hypothetical protein
MRDIFPFFDDDLDGVDIFKIKRFDILYVHGWLLWVSWSVLGMI